VTKSDRAGDPKAGSVPMQSLRDLLEAGRDDDVALLLPEKGEHVTYGQLVSSVDRLVAELRDLGVGRGDCVALVLPNGADFVHWILAMLRLGVAAAPLNPAYTAHEYSFYLDDLEPKLLMLPAGRFEAAREAAPVGVRVVDLEMGAWRSEGDKRSRTMNESSTAEATGDDIALLLHTSGTTSRPKQVPLLHRNVSASVRAIVNHYGLGASDVSYCVMPLFHVHGLVACLFAALAAGGSVVVPERVSPRGFWESLQRDGVTWFSAAPTLHQMLLDKRPSSGSAPTRNSLRFVRSCSSALPRQLSERMESEFEAPILQAYGMTEGSHQIASNPLPPRLRLAHSVGIPTGTEITTLGADGRLLPAGQAGEVMVRGPNVMPGYRNNPEANTVAFVDGWLRTGDRGVVDEQGYLHLEGRIKELIIRGGENISPLEVEEIVLLHPAISEAVCFAVPDAKYGESVGAAVVSIEPVTEQEIIRHCEEYLAAFKVPTRVVFVESIPRTATGKPRRSEMAARYREANAD
jgi:acyl-CoA synthetase (AMP-forming)/AMP-acid ligase II